MEENMDITEKRKRSAENDNDTGIHDHKKTIIEAVTSPGQPDSGINGMALDPATKIILAELGKVKTELYSEITKLSSCLGEVENLRGQVEGLKVKSTETDMRLKKLENQPSSKCSCERLEKEVNMLKKKTLYQEAYSRRFNLVIIGVDTQACTTEDALKHTLGQYFMFRLGVSDAKIDTAHTIGDGQKVMVRFLSLSARNKVWRARNNDSVLKVQEDIPKEIRDTGAALHRCKNAAIETKRYKQVRVKNSMLYLDGVPYGVEDLEGLPADIRPSVLATSKNNETLVFFSKYSPFSNHYQSPFTVNDENFSCIEQFLAVKRARMSSNKRLENVAWSAVDPAEIKSVLNILHKDPKQEEWENNAVDIAWPAIIAKFQQNEVLAQTLIETGEKHLGEASTSSLWGTGFKLGSKSALQRNAWTGKNLLGKMLMRARETLRKEAKAD